MSAEEVALHDDVMSVSGKAVRRRRWGLIGLAALALAMLLVWTQRRPIAANVIDQKLAAWRVQARYRVADLGLQRQRLTNVVIGDPAHPDLVADWVAVDTSLSLSGAQIVGVRAGHVRLRGRLINGTLSLGSLDRLLPAPSGKPFALPAIDITVDDARMRLESPQGVIGLKLAGTGRLDDGFRGTIAAVSDRLTFNGCHADAVTALVRVSVTAAQPRLEGPIRAGNVDCAGLKVRGALVDQDTSFGTALDRWQGSAKLRIATAHHPQAAAREIAGTVGFSGSSVKTTGAIDLAIATMDTAAGSARNVAVSGSYQLGSDARRFDGRVSGSGSLARRGQATIAALERAAPGTPVAPLLQRLADAGLRAARDVRLSSDVVLAAAADSGSIDLSRLEARSASGAVATLTGNNGLSFRWGKDAASNAMRVDGLFAMAGGGLPNLAIRLVQDRGNGVIRGVGLVRDFRAGDARLALNAVDFGITPGGRIGFATRATLSGPLGDGRLENATLPITGSWDGSGRLIINPHCAPVSIGRLILAGLDLKQSRAMLCPTQGALLSLTRGQLAGGGRIDGVRLAGTLGGAPLALGAEHAAFDLARSHFVLRGVMARLGTGDHPSLLGIAVLNGDVADTTLHGDFDGAAGQIANVPLLMSGGVGGWTFLGGKLSIDGALSVADANAPTRFEPLNARHLLLTLADNRIAVSGTLNNPATGAHVSDVNILHDLSSGEGRADLLVPGLQFGTKLQPDQLTRLTYGVIANVVGTVAGEGHIRWNRDGVTSDGVFRTVNTNLAAAFGPVTGLTTEIRFTDLLNMVSAPDQIATVGIINPGVAVENGVVRYALLADQRVDVRGAEWPFAGGRLVLEPTVLDFTQHRERRLPFRIEKMDAAQFLQQFDFKNLDATGTFDGSLPMIFSDRGGRIEGGHLKVREAGGTIAYVGELSQKDLGFWGNMAFRALKALKYQRLEIEMNGPLDGEVITDVRFAGISQGKGTRSNFLIKRLAKLPLVFNVRIQAPFRQLLDSAQGFYDPTRLIERNLPALIKAQEDADRQAKAAAAATLPKTAQPIQPPESEKRP